MTLDDYKHAFEMYRRAWMRELGGRLFHATHEIDALVKTTREMFTTWVASGKLPLAHRWAGDGTDDLDTVTQPFVLVEYAHMTALVRENARLQDIIRQHECRGQTQWCGTHGRYHSSLCSEAHVV